MGGHPWYYFVPYQHDLNKALQELRNREFNAGRYSPATLLPRFPIHAGSSSPGPKHVSIKEALKDADADGTRSILDIGRVAERRDYGVVAPLSKSQLMRSYGTVEPTRKMVEEKMYLEIERGQAIYIIVFDNGHASEIFFVGYSYD
jgi:hypothetical protein